MRQLHVSELEAGRSGVETAHPLVRLARIDRSRAPVRLAVASITSVLLFAYVGSLAAIVWLAAVYAIEGVGIFANEKIARGDISYDRLNRVAVFLTALAWVAQAWMLWQVGGEIPRISAIIALLTVALYGAIGVQQDRRMMIALMAPPLIAFAYLAIDLLWRTADTHVAIAATLATLGSCATIIVNGFAMNQSDEALTKANAVLAEHAEAARRANAAKDVFLANLSHEIRTPLNGVVGIAGALMTSGLGPHQREMAGIIHRSGEMLERLLNDLLDLSKIEAEAFTLHIAPFDLRETIETAAHLMRVRADDKGLAFYVDCGPSTAGTFEGDALRLRQIISNLVGNAVKFTEAGSVTVCANVETAASGDTWLSVAIKDTGPGFDGETAARLFKRFEQASAATAVRYGGTGLGLSISAAIAGAMGGAVTAQSTPREGSTFTLRVPLKRTALPMREIPAASVDATPSSLRILLAEDNALNQKVFSLLLAPSGARITFAQNGAEAIALFREAVFDIVLMDMNMPVMGGLEATQALRRLERDEGRVRTPVAMLSANAMQDHVRQALDAGCDGHISKPASMDSLASGIKAAIAACRGTARQANAA